MGAKLAVIVAGFFGGVISMAFVPKMSPGMRYVSVFSGVSCAMFFTPLAIRLWGFLVDFEPAVAFILGIGGMAIVGKIHAFFQSVDLLQILKERLTSGDKKPKK